MSWLRMLMIRLSPGSPIKRADKLSAMDTPRAARAIMGLARAHHEKFGYKPFADALKRMRHPALVGLVMEQMHLERQSGGPLTALNLLTKMGDPRFVPALLVQLKERYAQDAAELLADIGDRRAVAPLCELLLDRTREPYDRNAAAEALGKLADPSAIAPLVQALKLEFETVDKSTGGNQVIGVIAEAVGRIGDDDAIAAMAGLLEGFSVAAQAKVVDTELYWRYGRYDAIVKGLQYTKSLRATESLLSVLEVSSGSLRDRADLVKDMQRRTIRALGKIADPVSLDWILAAYPDREFVQVAAEALAAFSDPQAQEIVAGHRKKKERCFMCGKDEMQAMLSPSASTLARAGGDRAVASMVSYMEAMRSGKAVVKCQCGMWACHACLAAWLNEPDATYTRIGVSCPGCNSLFTRSKVEV